MPIDKEFKFNNAEKKMGKQIRVSNYFIQVIKKGDQVVLEITNTIDGFNARKVTSAKERRWYVQIPDQLELECLSPATYKKMLAIKELKKQRALPQPLTDKSDLFQYKGNLMLEVLEQIPIIYNQVGVSQDMRAAVIQGSKIMNPVDRTGETESFCVFSVRIKAHTDLLVERGLTFPISQMKQITQGTKDRVLSYSFINDQGHFTLEQGLYVPFSFECRIKKEGPFTVKDFLQVTGGRIKLHGTPF